MSEFRLESLRPVKVKKKKGEKKLFKNTDHLQFYHAEEVVLMLAQAILEGDREFFTDIIMAYLSAVNKEELSRRSKVPIATIRRMAVGSNFNVDNLLKVTKVLKKAS